MKTDPKEAKRLARIAHLESNLMIAEFMGLKEHNPSEFLFNNQIHKKDDLPYHYSWDWIMPVLEKICSMTFTIPDKHGGGTWSPCLRTFGMKNDEGKFMVRLNTSPLHESDKLIDATYAAVVEFIKENK